MNQRRRQKLQETLEGIIRSLRAHYQPEQVGFREEYYSQVCFLTQQAAEKCFKAFLLAKGRTYPRLHKVVELAALCGEMQKDLEPFKNDLKLLDEFYIPRNRTAGHGAQLGIAK